MKEACTVCIVYSKNYEKKYNNQLLIIFVEKVDIYQTCTNYFDKLAIDNFKEC